MKDIVEHFSKRGKIFKSLREIDLKDLNSRKRLSLYLGTDLNDYYTIILKIEKKSRILSKEAIELMDLQARLEILIDSKISKRYMLLNAPICSKAKLLLEDNHWKVKKFR